MGVSIQFDEKKESIQIKAQNITKLKTDYEKAGKMRASFLIMGALLARCGEAMIPLPGGCPIGSRPVDLHLKGFSALGAKSQQSHGFIHITSKNYKEIKFIWIFQVWAQQKIL